MTLSELKLNKRQCGLYKLYDVDKNLIYIGKSRNLKVRVVSTTRYQLLARYISIMLMEDSNYLDLLEWALIDKYEPIFNKPQAPSSDYIWKHYKSIPIIEDFSELISIDLEQKMRFCSYDLIRKIGKTNLTLKYHYYPSEEKIEIPNGLIIDEIIF